MTIKTINYLIMFQLPGERKKLFLICNIIPAFN